MRLVPILALLAALSGCGKVTPDSPGGARGERYVGVGSYPADEVWAQQTIGAATDDKAAATLDDDHQIIVVLDSRTGEIVQCGNLSAHCIAMNPWQRLAPVDLDKHRAELRAEAAAEQK